MVISILVILGALAFPTIQSALDSAKKTQAKNDAVQIVTAINAFYTEYGQYPCGAQSGDDSNDFLAAQTGDTQNKLMDNLRARFGDLNVRQIPFISPPNAKDPTKPRAGIGGDGKYYDPWGNAYRVRIDNNYNNVLLNPYTADSGAGPQHLNTTVIAWSLGKNGSLGGGPAADPKYAKEGGSPSNFASSGDVISWQ